MSPLIQWAQRYPLVLRWSLVAIVVIVLASMAIRSVGWSDSQVCLLDSRDLTRDELGAIQVAFGKSGLNDYEIRNNQVWVPYSDRANYLKSLADHDAIPWDFVSRGNDSTSSFDLFQTRAQQRLRQLAQKKQTIRELVMQLRFVSRAIVDYDETRGATPFDAMQRTAVVNVTPDSDRPLEPTEIKAIRDTVRGAVAGLRAEEITIIDTFASRSYSGTLASDTLSLNPMTALKLQSERKYENKIRSALTAYPGIRVNVEVTMDPVTRRIRDRSAVESAPQVVGRTLHRETSRRVPGTRPSVILSAFGLGANSQAQVTEGQPPVEHVSESVETMSGRLFETTESRGPQVNSVNVSIGIPERCVQFFVDHDRDIASTADRSVEYRRREIFERLKADIRQKVGPLIPVNPEIDQDRQIAVTLDRKIEWPNSTEVPAAPVRDTVAWWHWVLWPVAAVLLILGVWARQPAAEKESKASSTFYPAGEPHRSLTTDPEMPNAADDTNRGFSHPLDSETAASGNQDAHHLLRDQLEEWCRENPETAAATIRQWLNRKAG